ncbi:glycosyltransferase family 4 protein [Ramlibacter sp. MMS24-I3-19]|uniref:glycosyltransferase family 4 protein n=1 Tax=Ramlibacter sp. MMS24-I3-19 TaxID=3416606 RepID=UPI003D07DCB5
MKVVLGTGSLLSPLTGIGQYALQLADGLCRTPAVEPWFFYGQQVSRENPAVSKPWLSGWGRTGKVRTFVRKYVPNAYGLDRQRKQLVLNRLVRRERFDVYHEPNYLALDFDGPTVITVHDLSWIRYPETHPIERVRAMNRYFEPALRKASLLLTDSEFVGRELVEVFGIDPAMIRPILLGLDPMFRPRTATETAEVMHRLELEHGGYFLSVGTLEPRKNMQATVSAYSRLPASVRRRHPLVIAGMRGWRTSKLESLLEPLVASGELRMLGYLSREDLAMVTAGALTMVYPSVYEGFGLPPLESMGCGVAPIASNRSSLPEVVGDAGLQVDPDDADQLVLAMTRLAEDAGLRQSLSNAALERAQNFTWERCVSETVAAYGAARTVADRAATSRA